MNKTKSHILLLFLISIISFAFQNMAFAQEPWSEKQLIEPSELAAKIKNENVKSFHYKCKPGRSAWDTPWKRH